MFCPCPPAASLATIPDQVCAEDLKQVQRAFITRRDQGQFADEAAFAAQATWTPLFAAVDSTKIVKTPLFENLIIPVGEPITEGGGDNTTLNGEEIVLGTGPIVVTGTFRSIQNAIIQVMQGIACESKPGINPGLGIILANEFGQLIASQPLGAGNPVEAIDITSLYVPDAGNEGKNTDDKSNFRWNFRDGWRNGLILVTPDFDPLSV